MNTGTLVFFCGKMGAGKSTLAKTLSKERKAILLSEDTWLASHYPELIKSFEDYLKYSSLIKPFVKKLVIKMLTVNTSVVMDFPANTVKQRKWYLELCKEIKCNHEMFYLNKSNKQCLIQIKKRSVEEPERAQFDTESMFYEVTKYFESPSENEGLNIIEIF